MEPLTIALTALGLAAASGFRAFLPLFGLALLQRSGAALPLSGGWDWLSSDTALIGLGAACVVELLGDKVPVVDNLLDALGVVVRPAAGVIVALAASSELGTAASIVLAAGALPLSGTIASAKAAERGASTATTAGLANPFLSIRDDLLAGLTVILAVLAPLLLIPLGYLVFRVVRGMVRRVRAGGRGLAGLKARRPRREARAVPE